jgi:hypothetical protein|tara:strand:- start:3527 stop:3982 length:456 start_codon:yes stop_codon:yes gene_type:complete
MKYFMGLDPGKSGGIALISEDGEQAIAQKVTDSERDLWLFFKEYSSEVQFAKLELVHSSPQMGVRSAFSFGGSYGFLRGILIASEIPFDEVRPQKWMKHLSCLTGGDKNVTKRKAQQLFPKLKITHAVADALLIAEYCRQIRLGSKDDCRS